MTARRFLKQRRCFNLAAALAIGSVSWTSPCDVRAAEESVAPAETPDAKETALGAFLLQAGEAALQKKNVKVARKDLIKARKLLHAEKNVQLEVRALNLLSQLEAAATNRRLSASYAAQAKALEEEMGGGATAAHEYQSDSDEATAVDGTMKPDPAEPTDAGPADALGNRGATSTAHTLGSSDALPKAAANPDALGDALIAVVEVSSNVDAAVTTDLVPAVAEALVQEEAKGPNIPTAIAIMLGAWTVVSSLLILRRKRRG